jgi:hypothetical protein
MADRMSDTPHIVRASEEHVADSPMQHAGVGSWRSSAQTRETSPPRRQVQVRHRRAGRDRDRGDRDRRRRRHEQELSRAVRAVVDLVAA